MKSREYSTLDQLISGLDSILSQFQKSETVEASRPYPAELIEETELDQDQRKHIAGLMRVNHAGEVAAQALYKAQAITALNESLRKTMQQSANEEVDHLEWCKTRLEELNDDTSLLEPVWYFGSFGIGFLAGLFGDKWNLGFLAETEYQVVRHLDSHLEQLPDGDKRSRAILEKMRDDELHHATKAETAGAKELPKSIKRFMNLTSKVMTKTAYRI